MTIKYEPVFGDQSLFDNAPEDAELAVKDNSDAWFYTVGKGRNTGLLSLDSSSIKIAMRRIIKTPTWTLEDKKAGRLPEVGCVVMAIDVNEVARIAAINNDSVCSVCVVFEDGGFITLHFSGIAPIETPAEKAQREEDEFVESTCRQNEPHSTLYSDGVRAAYRKLKGGDNVS